MRRFHVEPVAPDWKGEVTPSALEKQLDKASDRGWSLHSIQTVGDSRVVIFEQE